MASSVPSRPSYFLGTLSKSISRPGASSPIATHTPPAPKSLHRLISFAASPFLKSRCIFRSVGGLPFCTWAPQTSTDFSVWAMLEPVAPPMPSRPVAPPRSTTMSPGAGSSRRTFPLGEAPTTAPISSLFAT